MWANFKNKMTEFTGQVKQVKLSAVPKPDLAKVSLDTKDVLGRFVKHIEAKHLIYFALILLPAIVGLGVFCGIADSKAKLEAVNLPENQLIRMGVNFNADDFVKYAGRGEKEITALFMEAGMSPDSYRQNDGFTPLHAAAAYGKASVVRQLLDKGADINARDKDGQTALMKAVWNNHADVVSTLLQRGATFTVSDIKGNNVISMAKTKNDKRVLDALVKAGINELKEALDKALSAPGKTAKAPNANDAKVQASKSVSAPAATSGNFRTSSPAVQPAGEFTLVTGYAGAIGVGKPINSLYQRFGNQSVADGEEFFAGRTYPVVRAYEKGNGLPALTVFFANSKQGQDKVISAIRVYDSRYKTASGIGVGATLGELKNSEKISSIQYTDSLYAIVRDTKMRYELDISSDAMPLDWLSGGDTSTLPDSMKIRSIFIF